MSFTRSLAMQLAPSGIRVNGVAPGPVITSLQPASRSAEEMEGFGVGMPLHGRAAQPAELGPSFVFLASPDSNSMTGACIHVNSRYLISWRSPRRSSYQLDGQHVGGS
jgi:NAD(P)-dependent dehydrogenase (short-subunit alcohol dehydrogenase family)